MNGTRPAPEPGRVLLYFGPRRGWFRRRGIASASVLAVSEQHGVVHVRTYRAGGDAEHDILVDIGHLPITFSALTNSISEIASAPPQPIQIPPSVYEWNERRARDEVGAFSMELWEAEQLAWETARVNARDVSPSLAWIEYAFPKRDADGAFRTVEVAVRTR